MFVTYKLKVADAEAAGIDTTQAFRSELQGYCAELAKPYLRDTTVQNRLVEEAYSRMGRQVNASHIMVRVGSTIDENERGKFLLDSLRTLIAGGADFADLARRYSADGGARVNGGNLGWISPNQYPYPFEYAAYNTPVGELSEVIDDTPFGYHIIRVEGERQDAGKVHARHILIMADRNDPQAQAKAKIRIDSIYRELQKPDADFAGIAQQCSQDPGSARRGGDLGFFGQGRMVPEFDQKAFSMADGEISEPFATQFGYHIIQVLEHKAKGTLEEERAEIEAAISRDQRANMPETERLNQLKQQYRAVMMPEGLDAIKVLFAQSAGTVAEQLALAKSSQQEVASIDGRKITAAEVYASIPENKIETSADAYTTFYNAVGKYLGAQTLELAQTKLADDNADYRNLVNEYRDGILLFEISNRNVWERAQNAPGELEEYFQANRDRYQWNAPHFKGYVLFATADSVADQAMAFLTSVRPSDESMAKMLRAKFGRNVKVERVIASKGENAIIDNLAFEGPKPEAPSQHWAVWRTYQGQYLDQPQEAADVRQAVSADFQQDLETRWVKQLHEKYPVKLEKKTLKKLYKK